MQALVIERLLAMNGERWMRTGVETRFVFDGCGNVGTIGDSLRLISAGLIVSCGESVDGGKTVNSWDFWRRRWFLLLEDRFLGILFKN